MNDQTDHDHPSGSQRSWQLGQSTVVVLGNLVPLVAVFGFHWNALTVVLIYWFEAVVIGVVTFLKMTLALPGYRPNVGQMVKYRQRTNGASRSFEVGQSSRLVVLPMFVLGYSGALAFVGVFLVVFAGGEAAFRSALSDIRQGGLETAVLVAVLVFEHAFAAYVDFFRGPAWARSDPVFHMWRPVGRFVAFYFLILIGGAVVNTTSPQILILPFVTLKLVGDLFAIPFKDVQWERRAQ